MKEFDLEAAKAGKKVETREGKKARIICFDRKDPVTPIVALISEQGFSDSSRTEEQVAFYAPNGHCNNTKYDLVMASEKNVGWVNIYYDDATAKAEMYHEIYATEEIARHQGQFYDWIATVKIEWEE